MRCRSEEGINEEEMKRIARTCMRNVGHRESNSSDSNNSDGDDDNDSDDDNDNDDNDDDDYQNGRNRNQYNNRGGGGGGGRPRQRYDYRRFRGGGGSTYQQFDRQQTWGTDNTNHKQGQQSYQSNRRGNRYDQNYATNNTDQDRNCLMHCFFREMKMVRLDYVVKIYFPLYVYYFSCLFFSIDKQ